MALGLAARALALLAVASVALLLPLVSAGDEEYRHCEGVVRGWAASSSTGRDKDGDKLSLKDLLFFLHIPRTGGRTYFHCFLKKLYTNAQECPRSYDKLRFDPSHPDCKLVVSHDDYSLTSKFPRERTSVVTILRNPVDRVFSTYEFSVEVAARFLVHANLTSAKLMTTRVLKKSRAVSTLDIWPWKYLVPWMREDLFARRDARIDKLHSSKKVNAYDVEDMVMPLHQYINDPVAHEIIHNGATFQITGLTNNSYFDGAHEVRHCVRQHPDLGHIVLEVAKNRLDQMLYVGLTEDHEESARLFAHMVGGQVLSQSGTLNLDLKEDLPSENDSHPSMVEPEDEETNEHLDSTHGWQNNEALNSTSDEQANGNMTVGKLMEAYETCIAKLRKSQSNRRKISLKKVEEANFSKEARKLVPEAILKQIISLNSLDMELYDHAKKIFTQEHLMLKAQQSMVGQHRQLAEQKGWIDIICNDGICSPWIVAVLGLGITATIALVSFAVTTRRRTSKLKDERYPMLPEPPMQPPGQGLGLGQGVNRVKLMADSLWKYLKKKFIRYSRLLHLNDESYASWMSYLSNAAVMAILTLNIYSASYFLAWRKEGDFCHIFSDSANAPDAATSEKTTTAMIRLILVSIPFSTLPVTLCIGGLAKVSKETVSYLGCVSGLVMLEIMYTIFLGGIMTACMSNVSGSYVAFVTLVLLGSLLVLWGFCCHHPKCLRYVVLCKCCCLDIDGVNLDNLDMV